MKPIKHPFYWLAGFLLLCCSPVYAQLSDSTLAERELTRQLDSLEASINYQTGKIALKDFAELDLPPGFKYIPEDKTNMIVGDIWGNPLEGRSLLGMVVKENYTIYGGGWAFILEYDESGYVKDEDADDIDYDEMLQQMQEGEAENNKEREKMGYPSIHLAGWAVNPYYDKEHKVLHWAKKLEFGGENEPTLNYDVRLLGRKGVLSMNAVGGMDQLDDINENIPAIVKSAKFTNGNTYNDFNPSVDKVAAYTIGGLIAGKLIAKTGIMLLLLKNIKLIIFGLIGGFAVFRKRIAGWFSREKNDIPVVAAVAAPVEDINPATDENVDPQDENNADRPA